MSLIYNILAKHFLNETTEVEEEQIAKFKKDNLTEYNMLAELWKRGDIKVKDFDSDKAWKIVQSKVNSNNKKIEKTIPIYQKIRRLAAVAAILIMGTFLAYYFTNNFNAEINIVATTSNNDNTKKITLNDGSIVWLNKNATLIYSNKFAENDRTVQLTGEAFFNVSKNKDKPFIINTSNSIIQVLGTSFNINSNMAITNVTVATGKVSVSNTENSSKEIITPGYSASINKSGVEKYKTNNPNYLSWKTGTFTFENTGIREVVKSLNTYYKTQIEIAPTTKKVCSLSVKLDKEDLEEILEIIKLTCNMNIKKEHNKYILY